MVQKAVMIGWAMTGGQDRAAAVRRVILAAAVRVAPVRKVLAATVTPRLKTGALRRPGRRRMSARPGSRVRPGSLIPNPLVRAPGAEPVRLDAILAGRSTVLTARQPEGGLTDLCDRYGIQLLRVRPETTPGEPAWPCSPGARQPDRWIEVRLAGGELSGPMRALIADPALAVLVRPDRVIAAAAAGCRLPVVPWPIWPHLKARPSASAHATRPDPSGQTGR
jgi:3-(3-hydroxy-phenyl)propionate hydroxylase